MVALGVLGLWRVCAAADTGWLVRVRAPQRTYAVREDGGFLKELSHPAPRGDPSPGGDRVLHKEAEGGEYRLFVADPDGKDGRALAGGALVGEARWAADGTHVLYVSAAAGRPQAYSADSASGAVKQLTQDEEGVRHPQQAADGTLAYLALRWKKRLEEYRALPLDERLARKGSLDRVDLVVVRGGTSRVVATDAVIHDYALRPDGGAVAYGTTGKLVIAEVGTDARREIPFTRIHRQLTSHRIASLAWRPDGRALLFQTPFTGGRAATDAGPVFGDRECFVFTLVSGRVHHLRVEPSASVDWITRGES